MKNKSILVSLLLGISMNLTMINSFAQDNKYIGEVNRTETETSLVISSNNIESIRLPNGNWVNSDKTTYTVNRNGTYDFLLKTNDGKTINSSYTVKELRKNLLVTNKKEVLLKLNSEDFKSGMGYMRFKNEENGTWTEYEPYKTSKDWTLDTNEGLKSVYVTYKDNVGNEAVAIYDQIYLDLTGPEVTKFVINNDDAYTKDRNVILNVNAVDNYSDVDYLLISNDNQNWTKVDYMEEIPWTLSLGAGNKTVYLKAVDTLGNISEFVSDDIYFDDILPYGNITINNGDVLTTSRDVKLQLSFGDLHSGVKRVTIHEGDKSYTFPTIPNSPTEIDWTLSIGTKGVVTMEIEDKAGNIYRVDSNQIYVSTLDITQFRLTNVVNPNIFNGSNPFVPLTWDFVAQEMLAGGNIEFDINYKFTSSDEVNSTISSLYTIEIIGDGYYEKIEFPYQEEIYNGFKSSVKIPSDAPKNAKVYISSKISGVLTTEGKDYNVDAYFPGEGEKALIGIVTGHIKETIKFNEIS